MKHSPKDGDFTKALIHTVTRDRWLNDLHELMLCIYIRLLPSRTRQTWNNVVTKFKNMAYICQRH